MTRKVFLCKSQSELLGTFMGRFGWAEVPLPGGCDLGGRPIDQHIKGFVAMGADVDVRNGLICAKVPGGRLSGGQIYLDMVSVGATMNIMLAGVLADGMTIIENAAKEPHIVDLANFLNSMGANIMGAGTDVIKIRGVKRLKGGTYSIIPDQIDAKTFHCNFSKYVNGVRLNYAVAALENTMDSITNICLDCGFESQRTFNRVFKERYKITPREYRKRIIM